MPIRAAQFAGTQKRHPMRALALLLAVVPLPVAAACPNESEIFSCTVNGKPLQICHWKGALIYNFGPVDKPELSIAEPLETVGYYPWPGFSRSIWSSVTFLNKGVSYEVWASFDRLQDNAELEGGITVREGQTTLAELTCDRGSVSQLLDVVSDLKYDIGQCWDFDSQSWLASCS